MMLLLLGAVMVFTLVVVDNKGQRKFPEDWDRQTSYVERWGLGFGSFYLVLYAVWLWFLYF